VRFPQADFRPGEALCSPAHSAASVIAHLWVTHSPLGEGRGEDCRAAATSRSSVSSEKPSWCRREPPCRPGTATGRGHSVRPISPSPPSPLPACTPRPQRERGERKTRRPTWASVADDEVARFPIAALNGPPGRRAARGHQTAARPRGGSPGGRGRRTTAATHASPRETRVGRASGRLPHRGHHKPGQSARTPGAPRERQQRRLVCFAIAALARCSPACCRRFAPTASARRGCYRVAASLATMASPGPRGTSWNAALVGQLPPDCEPATIKLPSRPTHPARPASLPSAPRNVP
jgi:hypothetical protein